MATITLSTRMEPDELALLDELAESSGLDRSSLVKTILRKGLREMRFEQAAEAYRKGRVSLSRAAELAGLPLWDLLSRLGEADAALGYEASDFENDLRHLSRTR